MPDPTATPPVNPAASTAPELVSGASLNGELPQVNENAVRAALPVDAPVDYVGHSPFGLGNVGVVTPADTSGVDKLGRKFDPAKFRPGKDSAGRWLNLRGGRKPKAETAPKTAAGSVVPEKFPDSRAAAAAEAAKAAAVAPPAPSGPDTHDLTAEAYTRSAYAVCDAVTESGGEWQPDDASEHDGLKAAVAAYLRTLKGSELPPGAALIMAVVTFVLKRLRRIKTANTLAKYFPALAGWLGVKKPEPAKPAATETEKKATPAQPAVPAKPDPFGGLLPSS